MRLVTRSDFDGLICGVLLKEVGLLEEWKFVHPKDVQDGKVEVTENDILANVPYAPGCGMWFDHHSSEEERHGFKFTFKGESRRGPQLRPGHMGILQGARDLQPPLRRNATLRGQGGQRRPHRR